MESTGFHVEDGDMGFSWVSFSWRIIVRLFKNVIKTNHVSHVYPICVEIAWTNFKYNLMACILQCILLLLPAWNFTIHGSMGFESSTLKNAAKWPKKNANTSVLWNFIQHIPFHTINTVAFHKVPILHADTWRNVVQKLNRVCFVRNPPVTKVQPPLFRTKTELLTQTKSKCGINPKTQCTNRCKAELF